MSKEKRGKRECHHKDPAGENISYLQWHEWMLKNAKRVRQELCSRCGLWVTKLKRKARR